MSNSFYVEPWQVESTSETLTLREAVTLSDLVLGGVFAMGLALIVAAVDYWLWQRRTIDGLAAAMLALFSVLLAVKGTEQFWNVSRFWTMGPRCLTFRRGECLVELEGFRRHTRGQVERIEIEVRTWQQKRATGHGSEPRHEYTALLVLDDQRLELGTYGAEAAANRLADIISDFAGIRAARLSAEN